MYTPWVQRATPEHLRPELLTCVSQGGRTHFPGWALAGNPGKRSAIANSEADLNWQRRQFSHFEKYSAAICSISNLFPLVVAAKMTLRTARCASC